MVVAAKAGWCNRVKLWKKALGHTLELVAIADIEEVALGAKAKKYNVCGV